MAEVTSDPVVATRRKLGLVLVGFLVLCISVKAESNFTISVNRRSTGDLYQLNQSKSITHMNCAPNTSYLVNEKQCVLDEDLFYGMKFYVDIDGNLMVIMISDSSGCSTAIAPMNSTFLIPTTAIDGRYSVITHTDKYFNEYVVIFGFNRTNKMVNSSFCTISSLEVYRGREQAIEISHQGFSLRGNGSIEVR